MIPLKEKVRNIHNKLFFIVSSIQDILLPLATISSIPEQIENVVIGDDKLLSFIDNTIQQVSEDDLKGVVSIGGGTFRGCSGLTSITIPDSVTSIGSDAFSGCSALKKVYASDITSWLTIAFGNGSANPLYNGADLYFSNELVTEVIIPDSVTSIGAYAFYGCKGLTSITIPDSVTSIGSDAFRGCTSLTSIIIPDSVTSIGSSAFEGCTGLTSITILDGVTSIGVYAFYGCKGLTSITIPDSVTSISSDAFYNCLALRNIYIKSATPPTLANKSAIPSQTTIHVPVGSGDAYRAATNWSSFANKIVEDVVIESTAE